MLAVGAWDELYISGTSGLLKQLGLGSCVSHSWFVQYHHFTLYLLQNFDYAIATSHRALGSY